MIENTPEYNLNKSKSKKYKVILFNGLYDTSAIDAEEEWLEFLMVNVKYIILKEIIFISQIIKKRFVKLYLRYSSKCFTPTTGHGNVITVQVCASEAFRG